MMSQLRMEPTTEICPNSPPCLTFYFDISHSPSISSYFLFVQDSMFLTTTPTHDHTSLVIPGSFFVIYNVYVINPLIVLLYETRL